MGSGTRQKMERKAQAAVNNLNSAEDFMRELYNVYYPNYPEYFEKLEIYGQAVRQLSEAMEIFQTEI